MSNRFFNILGSKYTGNILAFSIIVIFVILSLVRTYPNGNTLKNVLNDTGDDWYTYARNGLQITHEGILMPSLKSLYYGPSGFLYNYFLALCFILFGEKVIPVFIIQHLMLGLSVALIYWTFRNKMRGITGALFLCTMFAFALLDVYKYYSSRLLSENLAIFIVALFFFCFIKGFEKNNLPLQLLSAVSMGLSILTRPNIALYGSILIPVVAVFYLKKGKRGALNLILFVFTLFLSSSFLAIRNYLVCGKWCFLPTIVLSFGYILTFHPIPTSVDLARVDQSFLYTKLHLDKKVASFLEYAFQKPSLFFGHYFKKILFCFGFLSVLAPAYHIRPHWMIMWIGYFIYLFLRINDRKRPEIWEVAVHLFIWCYYLTLMTTNIHNYGFRMICPVTSFVLLFAFMALDRIKIKRLIFK